LTVDVWQHAGVQNGERFVSAGLEAAPINSVRGERSGPVGAAWASALASPTHGDAPCVIIAAVWVNPLAADGEAVFDNNRSAMCRALPSGVKGGPDVKDALAAPRRSVESLLPAALSSHGSSLLS